MKHFDKPIDKFGWFYIGLTWGFAAGLYFSLILK